MARTGLAKKIHKPLILVSALLFLLLGIGAFLVLKSLVENSVGKQADSIASIFATSIRDDILNGFDTEVHRKCRFALKNALVAGVNVSGLDKREICNQGETSGANLFEREQKIFFEPGGQDEAGVATIYFQSSLYRDLLNRIVLLLILAFLGLLLIFWLVSRRVVKKETRKLTELASLLRESDQKRLEKCSEEFGENISSELGELIFGVERMSENWTSFQKELIKNERLNAVNESSRLLAHDIKSPLGAIKTASEMFDQKPDMSKKLLARGVDRIEKMLLEIVKNSPEAQLKFKTQVESANQLFTDIENELMDLYAGSSTKVTFVNKLGETDPQFSADADLVERAVRNLVKNAVEALGASGGSVTVSFEQSEESIQIGVNDTGPGLPEHILNGLSSGQVESTKKGGSGLGLIQVDQTMRSHGGEMVVESNSRGTSVKLVFPKAI